MLLFSIDNNEKSCVSSWSPEAGCPGSRLGLGLRDAVLAQLPPKGVLGASSRARAPGAPLTLGSSSGVRRVCYAAARAEARWQYAPPGESPTCVAVHRCD